MPLFAANSARGEGLAYKYCSAPTPNQNNSLCATLFPHWKHKNKEKDCPAPCLLILLLLLLLSIMNSTDTYSLHNSQDTINFVKEKFITILRKIIADIQENARHFMNTFLKHEKKFQGIPKSLIPDSRDVRAGFEYIENTFAKGHFLLIGNTLFVPYIISGVGKFFYTNCFQQDSPSLPGTKYPGFAITLKKKEEENDQLSDEFEVEFMDGYGDHNTGDHLEFVLWFAPKLAMEYLKWCIERNEATSSTISHKKQRRADS